jgi:hypothetical protein
MKRRNLIKSLTALSVSLIVPALFRARSGKTPEEVLLLNTGLAGFQYYQGEAVWSRLKEDSPLDLVREPKNTYDYDAVQVFWGKEKIGYIPREDNRAIAQLIDRCMPLKAKISRLSRSENPRERIGIAVEMVV